MHMVKVLAALGALTFSGLVNAQAYFVCGTVACPNADPYTLALDPIGAGPQITGVNDLNVDGDLFDVSISATAPASSPFVLSQTTAAAGQPLTGVDAGNALSAFWGTASPFVNGADTAGDQGSAFITAFAPAGALSASFFGATELWDVAQTVIGGGGVPTTVFGNNHISASNHEIGDQDGGVFYTIWTPIAAPEIDPTSAASGLTLLLGGLAALRGRRKVVDNDSA